MSVRNLMERMREEALRRLAEEKGRRKEFLQIRVLLPRLREKRLELERKARMV